MINIFILFFVLMVSDVYADTVLIRKSDGFPIEYQSGDVSLDVLLANNPLYAKNEVEIKEVTSKEYQKIAYEKIEKPEKEARKKEVDKKKNKIKQKLGLTDEDLSDLKEALND